MRWMLGSFLVTVLASHVCAQNKIDPAGRDYFEKHIRPVLVKECYACHSAEAKKAKGGLQLDTRAGLLEGGDTGPALVPGKPAESLLLKALKHQGPKMPNKDAKLSDEVIARFEAWIKMGAPDPREGKSQVQHKVDYVEGRKHWAYQPVKVIAPAQAKDAMWAKGEIDRYVLARIEAKGLAPAPDAAPHALLRRLTFDLTGLPPTPLEAEEFLQDYANGKQAAVEKVVDRLLKSKHFGAHWARHWLDGVRYNPTIETVDRYRNWVIKAYNEDLPYDQFVLRQLAGDLLPASDAQMHDDNLMATQLFCMNLKEMDLVEGVIEVVGQHFLGVSINCAKCHDHKYDAYTQADYYGLAGIFTSTAIGGQQQAKKGGKNNKQGTALKSDKDVFILAAQDGLIADTNLLLKGDPKQRGQVVPRHFPVVLAGDAQKPLGQLTKASGRLELAKWIASPDNPLTARVMANRLWQRMIGRGIVATPNDFGTQGDRPTHPELLDYLADRLVKSNWSVKAVLREIALSHTYQQSMLATPEAKQADVDNTLFTRMPRKRLQFEQIMDSLYFTAGRLDFGQPGLLMTKKDIAKAGKAGKNGASTSLRAIYGASPAAPRLFDGANPEEIVEKRDASVSGPQMLFFLNNPTVIDLAGSVAARAEKSATAKDASAKVTAAYRLLFARSPSEFELARANDYLRTNTFARYCHALICANEFIYLD